MSPFMDNITFSGANMLFIYRSNIPLFARVIADLMRLLSDGVIWPIQPMKIKTIRRSRKHFALCEQVNISERWFSKQDPMTLFRCLHQSPYHDGNETDICRLCHAKADHSISVVTYFLPGGFGGLGRSIASWMVEHGARNLVFTSRSGDSHPRAKELLNSLTER